MKPTDETQNYTQEVNLPRGSVDDLSILEQSDKTNLLSGCKIDERCPRELSTLPTHPCQQALNSIYQQGPEEQRCPWFIVHADSNYCFWAYQRLTDSKPHTLEQVAHLTNSTVTTTALVEAKAIVRLKRKFHNLNAVLNYEPTDKDEE